jgi:hypothetical protein
MIPRGSEDVFWSLRIDKFEANQLTKYKNQIDKLVNWTDKEPAY